MVINFVSCGEEHSAFITSNGDIFSMGSNAEGRLGIGNRTIKFSSTPCLVEALSKSHAKYIACGWGHTAAITDNGDLYTWGVGLYGALGIADTESQWFPVKVSFPEKSKVVAASVACGTRHTAIVDDRGRLYVCGAGDAGQLGNGSREKEILPYHLSSITEKVVQAACGIFHTLALTVSGKVLAMGGNNLGQLGIGTKRSSILPVSVTKNLEDEFVVKIAAGHHSAAVSKKGSLYIWGTGSFGEFLVPTLMKLPYKTVIKEIAIGGSFGVAVDIEGGAYSWGENKSGELGIGNYEDKSEATHLLTLEGKTVTQVSCGGSYVIALGRTLGSGVPTEGTVPVGVSESLLGHRISATPTKRSKEEFGKYLGFDILIVS